MTLFTIFHSLNLIINTTQSMPLGIYQQINFKTLSKNDLISFKIPDKKEVLFKKIVALKGDFVEVNQNGVFINNTHLPNSKIFNTDSRGNPLSFKPLKKFLRSNEYFVMGEHIKSYDSRYFGIINIKNNQVNKLKPILLWSKNNG